MKTKRKKGTGKRFNRLHSAFDMIGKATRKPSLIEDPYFPTIFSKGSNESREWHPKASQELLLATGWKSVHEKTILAKCQYPQLKDDHFFTEFPMTYSRSGDKYFLNACRLYLGRIEMPKCKKSHRCGIVDIVAENPFRLSVASTRRRPYLELLVEERCDCFNEESRDHEGTLFLYRWH